MNGFDKTKSFWLVVPIDHLDGSFTPPCADGRESFKSPGEAMAHVMGELTGGGQFAIYKCVSVSVIGELEDDSESSV